MFMTYGELAETRKSKVDPHNYGCAHFVVAFKYSALRIVPLVQSISRQEGRSITFPNVMGPEGSTKFWMGYEFKSEGQSPYVAIVSGRPPLNGN